MTATPEQFKEFIAVLDRGIAARRGTTFPELTDSDDAHNAGAAPADELDNHRNAPRPDPDCLYGLIGDVGRAANAGNPEVNPYAAALGCMVALCAGLGRGCYLRLGDDWHHPRLFALHVGRSGRGRKGTSIKLVRLILKAIEERHPDVHFQCYTGGLSSREGLLMLIHDGYTTGKVRNAEEVPAVRDMLFGTE
jgi:hypothetical protein